MALRFPYHPRDTVLVVTDVAAAFRPGDFFHAPHGDFEITRVARHRRTWLRTGRSARYVVYGVPIGDDVPRT